MDSKSDFNTLKFILENGGFETTEKEKPLKVDLFLEKYGKQFSDFYLFLDEYPDLIFVKDNDGRTLAHIATLNNQFGIVEYIFDENPKMNFWKDFSGKTCLHLAALKNNTRIVRKCLEVSSEEKHKLLKEGDENGDTAFHLAAKYNSLDVLELLGFEYLSVEEVNCQNKYGRTALHYAAFWKHVKAIDILIESGSDLNMEDNKGSFPLILAARENKKTKKDTSRIWNC